MRLRAALLPALLALMACEPSPGNPAVSAPALPSFPEPLPSGTSRACWALEERGQQVETVQDTVLVEPPGLDIDGTLRTEPLTRVETRETEVAPGAETWFETLCPSELTPQFIASLQRALAARGLYRGEVTGLFDAATGAAVRAYQAPLGLDSATLSRAAAQRLGLVVTPVNAPAPPRAE